MIVRLPAEELWICVRTVVRKPCALAVAMNRSAEANASRDQARLGDGIGDARLRLSRPEVERRALTEARPGRGAGEQGLVLGPPPDPLLAAVGVTGPPEPGR